MGTEEATTTSINHSRTGLGARLAGRQHVRPGIGGQGSGSKPVSSRQRSSRGRPRFAPPARDPKPKPGRRNDADDVRLLVTEQELRAGAASASDKTFSLWNVAT